MKKITGILLLLVYICVATALLNERFVGAFNMQNVTRDSALFGIIGIGVAFVIITGGIDLSIGSMIGLVGCLFPMMVLGTQSWPPGKVVALTSYLAGGELLVGGAIWGAPRWRAKRKSAGELVGPIACGVAGVVVAAAGIVVGSMTFPAWAAIACILLWTIGISLHLGLVHGLLITEARLQPFIVTLCALLIYRGMARWFTGDSTKGFGKTYDDTLRLLATGKPCTVAFFVLLAGLACSAWCAWKLIASRGSEERAEQRPLWGFGIVAGLVFALIGAARFKPESLLSSVTAEAAPSLVMNWIGWLVIPSLIWLLVVAFRTQGKRIVPALVVAVVASGVFLVALWFVRQGDASFQWAGGWAQRTRQATLFLTLGGVMGAIAWFGRSALRGGPSVLAPLSAAGVTAILWLMCRKLGPSSLADTLLGHTLVPAPFLFMLGIAAIAAVFLNQTIYGRYLLALGRNEQAARFSGIKTNRLVVLAYVLCGGATGVFSILFTLDGNSAQPSGHGSGFEMYAIAAAVLGGCSLRGGEGSITGVIIGAAVMRILYNSIDMLGIPTTLEYTIIGCVILSGVFLDETVKRIAARQRAKLA